MNLPIRMLHFAESVNGSFYVPHGDSRQNFLTKISFVSHGPL